MNGVVPQRERRRTPSLQAVEMIRRAEAPRPHIVLEIGLFTVSPRAPARAAMPCPLKKSLITLLQEAADEGDTGTAALAARLSMAPATIRNKFQETLDVLQVHNRRAAVALALEQGWITPGERRAFADQD